MVFGIGGKHNVNNAISTAKEAQSSAMSSAATTTDVNATCSATAKAKVMYAEGKGSENNLSAECVTTAVVDVVKTYTANQTLTNKMIDDISQKNSMKISGGVFAPDSNTDNSMNTTSSVGQAISSYSYMNTTMDASAYADVDAGIMIAKGGGVNKASAKAIVNAILDVKDTAVVTASGTNWMEDDIVQANKLESKGMLTALLDSLGKMLGPLTILALIGLVGIVMLRYGGLGLLSSVLGGGGAGGAEDGEDGSAARKRRAWHGFFVWYVVGVSVLLIVYHWVIAGLTVQWPSTQVIDSIFSMPPNFKKAFDLKWRSRQLIKPHPVPPWVTPLVVGGLLTFAHYKYRAYQLYARDEDEYARAKMMQQQSVAPAAGMAGMAAAGMMAARGKAVAGMAAARTAAAGMGGKAAALAASMGGGKMRAGMKVAAKMGKLRLRR